ncbi:MAG TPA: hypothetical protein VJB63_03745 [Patescibacteria group bacterium]|nr:hypothetical protein [Patescibacteria group bacterium]
MEKQKPFVNGVNEKKFGKVKNMLNVGLLTFATLFPLSHTAEAQRKDIEPPHPITQTQKDRPPRTNQTPQPTLVVPQKEQAHTQQSTESYHIEESDPFSQEKQWDRYLFIPPDEKEAVNKRLFTLSSETSIYISKPTIQYLQYEVNFEGITYEESIQRIISTMPSQLQNSMDKSKFIVIHRMNKQNTLVIEFETIPIQKQNVNDLEIQKTEKEPKKTSLFDQTTATLWTKNGQIIINPSIVLHPTVSANSTIKTNLSVFDQYAAWDETTQKIVLTNGIHILGTFLENNQVVRLLDPQGTSFIKPTPTIDYYETGIDRPTKMKKILHDSLLATPEIFDYPEEIKRYIETGDENDLHHIKLIPHNNPAFFIEIGGKYGFHNEKLIALLEEGINIIDSIDPKTLDLLNQYGLYGVLTDISFFKKNRTHASTWYQNHGLVSINEVDLAYQMLKSNDNEAKKATKMIRNKLINLLLIAGFDMRGIYERERITPIEYSAFRTPATRRYFTTWCLNRFLSENLQKIEEDLRQYLLAYTLQFIIYDYCPINDPPFPQIPAM